MVKFLDTTGVSHELSLLLKNADERIILLSPYLQLAPTLKDLIRERISDNIDISIVYGKEEHLNRDDFRFLQELSDVKVYFCDNLHAKCYINESAAIVTSMNLYQYSQQNNLEMGIKVDKTADPELYDEILDEAQRIIKISREHPFKKKKLAQGYCIRCKATIPLNSEHPFCIPCLKKRGKAKPNTLEKYCHVCGKQAETSFENPLCFRYRCQHMFEER
jgi:phosphatidylserine/phosphatidylglycerophosphate/cardiolipin synthase-like enzyme